MPKIQYKEQAYLKKTTRAMITKANEIIAGYMRAGMKLTLRQLYYRFVAQDLLPNTQRSYNNLGTAINTGRLLGMIDWLAIEDRTRNLQNNSHWRDPSQIVDACVHSYHEDLWATQPHRVEVWIEKEALAGVFAPICTELDVPLFPCRGYTSQSEMWDAGQRLLRYKTRAQEPVILHFGDHDPSGIDMTRDITDRLRMFSGDLRMKRVALTMDQIDQYNPPPNPAKVTDSRFATYVRVHGDESWELDALDPPVLVALVRDWVERFRDKIKWDKAVAKQERNRDRLAQARDDFEEGS